MLDRRMFLKTALGGLALGIGAPTILEACGSKTTSSVRTPGKGALPTVALGTALGAGQSGLVDLAIYAGFFRKHGVDVTLTKFSSGAALGPAVVTGDLHMAIDGDIPAIPLLSKDSAIRVLCPMAMYAADQGIVAGKDVSAGSDLAGKEVGLVINSTASLLLNLYLEEVGVSVKGVGVLNMAPPTQIAALAQGHIAAYVSWQPYLAAGTTKVPGAHLLAYGNKPKSLLRTYELLLVNSSYLKANEGVVRGVLMGMLESLTYLNGQNQAYQELAKAVAVEENPGISLADLEVFAHAREYTMTVDPTFVNAEKRITTFLTQTGQVSTPRPFTDFLDTGPLHAVSNNLVQV